MDEWSDYLEFYASQSIQSVILGDLNFHLEDKGKQKHAEI